MSTCGVEWVETQFGPKPEWTNEPDHEAILQAARQALNLNDLCSVRFLAQGCFNRVYVIGSPSEEYIFRVSLPMYRCWKTESEIATMEWVRQSTSLPVPRVFSQMKDPSQAVGYEWIIMEKVSGKPLEDVWTGIDYSCKRRIVKQLAAFAAATFEHKLRGIGSLYYCNGSLLPAGPPGNFEEKTDSTSFKPYGDDHLGFPFGLGPGVCPLYLSPYFERVPQGPFSTSREWVIWLLKFAGEDLQARLKEGTGSFVQGPEGVEAMTILHRLGALLDVFFPLHSTSESELTMLFHHDLSESNILVDDNGSLASVIDWEYMSTVPLFMGCQVPQFLMDLPCDTGPKIDDYEGYNDLRYWSHRKYYELTQLRQEFLHEMKRLQPQWVDIFESTEHQRDFVAAITSCREFYGEPMMCEILCNWLTDMESGLLDVMGLDERIFDAFASADT